MLLHGNLRRENPTYTYWCSPMLQRGVVLKWFYSRSHRNTFVGGTCAPPSPSGSLNITTRDKSFSIEQGSDLGVQSVRRLWHATVKCIYRMSVLSFVLLLQNVEKAIRLNVEKQMLQRLSENEGKSAVLKTGKTTKSSKTTA